MAETTHTSGPSRDRTRTVVAGVLVVLGLGMVANPLYLWPHYAQTGYGLGVERVDEVPATSIEYADLPPAAQAALDEAIEDDGAVLWSGEHDRAIDVFEDRPVVRRDGAAYRVTLYHGDSGDFIDPVLRWVLTAIGTLLVAIGGMVIYTASWTPLTPIRGVPIPAAVTVAFYATNAYDVLFSGVQHGFLSIPLEVVLLVPVTAIALPIGSAFAAGRDARVIAGGVVAMAGLGFAIGRSLHPTVLLVVGGILAVGGAPWFVLGYRLTSRA